MGEHSGGTPIDDIASLSRSDHRAPTLIALTVRPRSRPQRWEMTGGFLVGVVMSYRGLRTV